MIYLYITPSGSVNLIEGDKMPVKPAHCGYYIPPKVYDKYEDDLAATKASSVPVDDQEGGKDLILIHLKLKEDWTMAKPTFDSLCLMHIKNDVLYGPINANYRRGYKCKQEGKPTCTSSANCTCSIADGLPEVAILLSETDEDPIIKHKGKEHKFNLVPQDFQKKISQQESIPSDIAKVVNESFMDMVTPSKSGELGKLEEKEEREEIREEIWRLSKECLSMLHFTNELKRFYDIKRAVRTK